MLQAKPTANDPAPYQRGLTQAQPHLWGAVMEPGDSSPGEAWPCRVCERHSFQEITLQVYGHLQSTGNREVVDRLDNLPPVKRKSEDEEVS